MPNYDITPGTAFTQLLLYNHPGAIAWVSGSEQYPGLSGAVRFYHTTYGGVLVEAEIFGFPTVTFRVPAVSMPCIYMIRGTAAIISATRDCTITHKMRYTPTMPATCRRFSAIRDTRSAFFMISGIPFRKSLEDLLLSTKSRMTLLPSRPEMPVIRSPAER